MSPSALRRGMLEALGSPVSSGGVLNADTIEGYLAKFGPPGASPSQRGPDRSPLSSRRRSQQALPAGTPSNRSLFLQRRGSGSDFTLCSQDSFAANLNPAALLEPSPRPGSVGVSQRSDDPHALASRSTDPPVVRVASGPQENAPDAPDCSPLQQLLDGTAWGADALRADMLLAAAAAAAGGGSPPRRSKSPDANGPVTSGIGSREHPPVRQQSGVGQGGSGVLPSSAASEASDGSLTKAGLVRRRIGDMSIRRVAIIVSACLAGLLLVLLLVLLVAVPRAAQSALASAAISPSRVALDMSTGARLSIAGSASSAAWGGGLTVRALGPLTVSLQLPGTSPQQGGRRLRRRLADDIGQAVPLGDFWLPDTHLAAEGAFSTEGRLDPPGGDAAALQLALQDLAALVTGRWRTASLRLAGPVAVVVPGGMSVGGLSLDLTVPLIASTGELDTALVTLLAANATTWQTDGSRPDMLEVAATLRLVNPTALAIRPWPPSTLPLSVASDTPVRLGTASLSAPSLEPGANAFVLKTVLDPSLPARQPGAGDVIAAAVASYSRGAPVALSLGPGDGTTEAGLLAASGSVPLLLSRPAASYLSADGSPNPLPAALTEYASAVQRLSLQSKPAATTTTTTTQAPGGPALPSVAAVQVMGATIRPSPKGGEFAVLQAVLSLTVSLGGAVAWTADSVKPQCSLAVREGGEVQGDEGWTLLGALDVDALYPPPIPSGADQAVWTVTVRGTADMSAGPADETSDQRAVRLDNAFRALASPLVAVRASCNVTASVSPAPRGTSSSTPHLVLKNLPASGVAVLRGLSGISASLGSFDIADYLFTSAAVTLTANVANPSSIGVDLAGLEPRQALLALVYNGTSLGTLAPPVGVDLALPRGSSFLPLEGVLGSPPDDLAGRRAFTDLVGRYYGGEAVRVELRGGGAPSAPQWVRSLMATFVLQTEVATTPLQQGSGGAASNSASEAPTQAPAPSTVPDPPTSTEPVRTNGGVF